MRLQTERLVYIVVAIIIAVAMAIMTVGCSDSPTKPSDQPKHETREAEVIDTSTGEHRIHWNVALRLPDGTVGFVCGESFSTHRMLDGTVVKVSHMLSSAPCDAYGRGVQNFANWKER